MSRLRITKLKTVVNFHHCCRIAFKVNGKRTSGVIFYDKEVIVIHYNGARQLCLNEYNQFDGNLKKFLSYHLDNAPMFNGFTEPDISPEQLDFLGD